MHTLSLDNARRMAAATHAAAQAGGMAVTIAVCDAAGRLVLLQRDDGALPISVDLAPAKARTAALVGVPSGALEKAINSGQSALTAMPGCVCLGGGLPVRHGGVLLGGIAVSGAPSGEQDEALARHGLQALSA
jgi:uncharacterized protein GlcG (DUF336 family)